MLGGWKSWTGAIVSWGTGVAMVAAAVSDFPTVDGDKLRQGLEAIAAGFAIVGVAHKIEKMQLPPPPKR